MNHKTKILDTSGKGRLLLLSCAVLLLSGAQQSLAANADIPQLSGVWQWGPCDDGSGFGCMTLEEDSELLTNRAKAYRDAIDEAAQPKYDCAPISIPHMWTDPYSHQIDQLEDRVIFTYGKDDVVRTVWLEGHGHPKVPLNEYTYFGHSVGHYENGKLIVETTHFSFDPQGLNADFRLASSTQKKVVEVYEKQGDDLVLEVTTTDPFFLKTPWVYKVRSKPDPNELALPWACDLEASREWLELIPNQYPEDPPVVRLPE